VCGKNTYFSVGEYSLNTLISKLFQEKKDSLLSSRQYELFWLRACFRQHQNLAVPVKVIIMKGALLLIIY